MTLTSISRSKKDLTLNETFDQKLISPSSNLIYVGDKALKTIL